MELRILRATPIIRSQDPPMCEECGGLNNQVHPLLARKLFNCSSLHAPTKLVPQSDLSCLTGPLTEMNLRRAQMKEEESID